MRLTPILLLGALAAAACDAGTSATEPAVALQADEALQVTAAVAPATFRAGDAVTVTVTVTNTGTTAQQVALESRCPYPFTVQTPAGAVVGPEGEVCDLVLRPPRTVPAGGSVAVTTQWKGGAGALGGAALGGSTIRGAAQAPLAPGDYQVRGVVNALDPDRTLRSAPVSIRVLP